MTTHSSSRSSPHKSPPVIKWTIVVTLIMSFFALIAHALFTQVFNLPTPYSLFSLTTQGINQLFLWQFLSYLFIQPTANGGMTFSVLFNGALNIYLLWAIGSAIVQTRGIRHFATLYFGGGLFLGILAYFTLSALHSPLPFSGAKTSIYILLIAWTFLFPKAQLMMLLVLPMRAKWVVFGLIGVSAFLDFSNGAFFSFFTTLGALFYGYFYSLLIWEISSPFPKLHKIERKFIYLKRMIKNKLYRIFNVRSSPGKIYDLSGRVRDREFIDICLEKISDTGKDSLTLREKWRLHRLSKKKF